MFSWRDQRPTPLVVAHRGSSLLAPENTLAAFAQALRDGADAVELDVQLTADGHPVVIHDFTLLRTAGRRGRVEEATLAQLRALGPSGPRAPAPLLDEVFELVGRSAGINVELKIARRSRRGTARALAERVLRVIRAHRAEASTLLTSFNHSAVFRCAAAYPAVATGLLLTPLHVLRPPFARAEGTVAFFIAGRRSVTRGFLERCRRRGFQTGVYTVNRAGEARRLASLGAGMLITDAPAGILAAVRATER